MLRHKLVRSRIREGCRDIYIKMHNEIPAEVADEFREKGISKVVCFIDDKDLFVYTEYDDEIHGEDGKVTKEFVKKLEEKCKDNEYGRKLIEVAFEFNA